MLTTFICHPDIDEYCKKNTSPTSSLLNSLYEETIECVHGSEMISDILVIKVIQFLIKSSFAKNILDIGTYTGYSAIAMAEAINAGGIVYTLDRKVQPSIELAKKYFKKSINSNAINLLLGEALDVIPSIEVMFDFAFIDADKMSSPEYYNLVLQKLNKGGIIIIDDCLWRGKVINPCNDKRAIVLDKLNSFIVKDNRVDNVMLPVRHGINIIRKL